MKPRQGTLVLGGVLGALAILLGAFGAHSLEGMVKANQLTPLALERFETGARYHLIHALAIAAIGLAAQQSSSTQSGQSTRLSAALRGAVGFFTLGIILFSGMLYLYALTSVKTFAMIVPLGGLSFVVGWICLTMQGWRGTP